MRWYLAAVVLPLLADLLDRFVAWTTRKYRRQMREGDEYPPFRWLLWVRVTHCNPDYDHDLWVVKLPSWRFDYVPCWDEYRWTQFALLNRRPFQRRELFNGDGWRSAWLVSNRAAYT